MDDPALRTLKAHWTLSNEGFVEPNRRILLDLAFRLLAILLPRTRLVRTWQPVSSRYDNDEYGGSLSTVVYRLGDEKHGLEVSDSISDARDGMTPYGAGSVITLYGLPDGWALELIGSFIAPLYGRPNPMSLKAHLPPAKHPPITALLLAEFGATLDTE